jgi:hypothetical protein
VIRAQVRRDGPGEWSWTLLDDHGDLVTGVVGTWDEAIADVREEFTLLAESILTDDVEDIPPLVAPEVAARQPLWWRWLFK